MKSSFGSYTNFAALVDKVMAEYAGESVPEESEELNKKLVDFYSDHFMAGMDDFAAATAGNHT